MTALHPLVAVLVARQQELGVKQCVVAARLGVAKSGLSMLEAGLRRPRLDQVCAYAAVVGMQLTLTEQETK